MPTVEFGSKDAADAAREEYSEHLCPADDRRLLTVRFQSDTPEHVLDMVRLDAEDSKSTTKDGGQVGLSNHERDRIDFSKGKASVPHARSVKGIALSEGVDDWVAYYDPTLTVDEHREVMETAGREGGGKRTDEEDTPEDRAARAARTAKGEQCEHAEGHCRMGDPDACDFLRLSCGFDDDEIEQLVEQDDQEGEESISGDAKGALGRAWGGYQAGITRLDRELQDALEAKQHAEQAAAAINAIRQEHGQDPMEFERLENLSDRLQDVGEVAHDQQGHVESTERTV